MTRLNRLLSLGYEVAKVFEPSKQANKSQKVFTLTFDIDGITRQVTLSKEDAQNIINSANATWKPNL